MTAAMCQQHLDAEYEQLRHKLIAKMARKRMVPFLSGRVEISAAGIVYALGSINFLFDKSFPPYATVLDCAMRTVASIHYVLILDGFPITRTTYGIPSVELFANYPFGENDEQNFDR
jgi:hypothetical protein